MELIQHKQWKTSQFRYCGFLQPRDLRKLFRRPKISLIVFVHLYTTFTRLRFQGLARTLLALQTF